MLYIDVRSIYTIPVCTARLKPNSLLTYNDPSSGLSKGIFSVFNVWIH